MSLNDEQSAYLRYLSTVPAEKKCACGWYMAGRCPNCNPKPAEMQQPDLHMPGWPELRYHGHAKTNGNIWWWEERMDDGSIKRHPLQPYCPLAAPPLPSQGEKE